MKLQKNPIFQKMCIMQALTYFYAKIQTSKRPSTRKGR